MFIEYLQCAEHWGYKDELALASALAALMSGRPVDLRSDICHQVFRVLCAGGEKHVNSGVTSAHSAWGLDGVTKEVTFEQGLQ